VKLTTHLQIVSRLRMNGAVRLLPPIWFHGLDRDDFNFVTLPLETIKVKNFCGVFFSIADSLRSKPRPLLVVSLSVKCSVAVIHG
jgi:hypothetical protein